MKVAAVAGDTFGPMQKSLLAITLSCTTTLLHAQDQQAYRDLVDRAWQLYEAGDHAGSASAYSQAFEALGWKGTANDRYNAACSYALAGVPDSAFFHLYRVAGKMDYANVVHMTNDTDLGSLHGDARWQPLVELVQANKDRLEANFDKPLVAQLDSIFEADQALRREVEPMLSRYGNDSPEMQDLWRRIAAKDSANLAAVSRILDERGWLGADVIGGRGNMTLFLVVQHADLATQEKYLPLMREAVRDGRAQGSSLALLEDRVALRQGRRQTYGSQIGTDPADGSSRVLPLDDPLRVDERRATVGLGPLADYARRMNVDWDPVKYAEGLPALEQRLKEAEAEQDHE